MAYQINLSFKDDEKPAKINARTGEVSVIQANNPNVVKHDRNVIFTKFYTKAWKLLQTQTSKQEYAVAFKLAIRAKAFTNSLQPLGPELTTVALAEELSEDRRTITKHINKLISLGVLGTFKVVDAYNNRVTYWIFNPYLSFNGNTIDRKIAELFAETYYAKISDL